MKKLLTKSMEYKRLKKYWELIQKDFTKLNDSICKRRTHFRDMKTETNIINESIEIDYILKEYYEIHRILLRNINYKKIKEITKRLKVKGD